MSGALSEHIEYLTLPGRNDLYRKAIAQVMPESATVADLGCGMGVLGLFCLEHSASHVWGIDESEAICLAQDTMKRAGLEARYTCIADSTFNVTLPERVDMLICDHVGFFGFDYGIIRLMRDARARFLKPGGIVVPQSLAMMVAAVSSDDALAKAQCWGKDPVPKPYRWLEEPNRNRKFPLQLQEQDLISDAVTLGEIALDEDGPDFFSFAATLTANRDARFDGLAGWFDCQLAEGLRMTNNPLDPDSIKRAQAFFPALESFPVSKGDQIKIKVRFRVDDHIVSWMIQPPGAGKKQQLSTFNSAVLTPADMVKDSGQPLALSARGEARAFVLSLVNGQRTSEDITALVLEEMPDLFPGEAAIRTFVQNVLMRDCKV